MHFIDIHEAFPLYASLNKWDQLTVLSINREWPMPIERIVEIYLTLDKNKEATRIRVARECMFGYNKYL